MIPIVILNPVPSSVLSGALAESKGGAEGRNVVE